MQGWNTYEQVRTRLLAAIARRLGRAERDMDAGATFSALGLDSSALVEIMAAVAPEVPVTVAWECFNVDALARRLSGTIERPAAARGGSLGGVGERERDLVASAPMAIVGMSCRFPGAPSLEAFWSLLVAGRDAISPLSEARRRDVYGTRASEPGLMGGYLETVADFDPDFFKIAPREAVDVDPQQRLMLEVCWEALQDAGIPRERVRDSRTGVFVGCMWRDYATRVAGHPALVGPHTAVGHDTSIVSARVSYFFGARGPSVTINTACSSSLVAVHLACQSLREGDCELALVGGVNLILAPDSTLAMSRFGGLSPDGRCHTFDARANGYARGEGAGVLVLKRHRDAIKDGDHVYAVVLGSAINNDGPSNGITAPNPLAQEEVLRRAYARAGVDTRAVQYVEAHGTGTLLGDPIEVRALGAVLGAGRDPDRPLAVGAVKTNIGHLEGAAGVAGVIKTALALDRGAIPATVGIEALNPNIPFDALNVRPVRSTTPWSDSGTPPTAGVSAFGFGGTNCHLVMQRGSAPTNHVWSARESGPARIRTQAAASRDRLRAGLDVGAICGGAAASLGEGRARVALLASSRDEMLRQLEALASGETPIADGVDETEPVLIFAGQGSHEAGMGAGLLQSEPVFRRKLRDCAAIADPVLGCSLVDEILAPGTASRLGDPRIGWPATVAYEIALGALWRSLGVRARAVIGHSIGEIAAAHWAGVLSLEDALAVARAQGDLIGRSVGLGSMLLAQIAWEEAAEVERAIEGVHRAIHSSPGFTVFSGRSAAVAALEAWLRGRSLRSWRVHADVAAHVPDLVAFNQEMGDRIALISPKAGQTVVISTVDGKPVPGQSLDASYWVRSFHSPVLFCEAVSAAVDAGTSLYLEVSPRPLIARSVELTLQSRGSLGTVLSSAPRGSTESEGIRRTLADLHRAGAPLDWNAVYQWTGVVADGDAAPAAAEPLVAVPLSARDDDGLAAIASRIARDTTQPAAWDAPTVADLGLTFANHWSHHDRRAVVLAGTREQLAQGARMLAEGRPSPLVVRADEGRRGTPGQLMFVFSGQGSQWAGMARELVAEEPVCRAVVDRCEPIVRSRCGWSLIDVLTSGAPVDRTDVAQPALFVVQLALAELWRSWGVRPDGVVGHSVGEVAAACCAGALDLETATLVVCERALAMADTPPGQMIAVDVDVSALSELLSGLPSELSVAAVNGPRSVVIAGDHAATNEAIARLQAAGQRHKLLRTGYPFHSAFLEPARARLQEALSGLAPELPELAFYSTVTGGRERAPLNGHYWGRNVRETVQFLDAVRASLADGARTYLEIGPHPVLSGDVASIAAGEVAPLIVASMRRGESAVETMRRALAKLWVNDVTCDWKQVFPVRARRVPVPLHPWRRDRYWRAVEATPDQATSGWRLGREVNVAIDAATTVWQATLSGQDQDALLRDHRIGGAVLFPGAGYLSLALDVARRDGAGAAELRGTRFRRALDISDEVTRELQTTLVGDRLTVSSRLPHEEWELHAEATVVPAPSFGRVPAVGPRLGGAPGRIEEDIYAELADRGYEYGPAYHLLREIRLDPDGAEAELAALSDRATDEKGRELLVLDAVLQAVVVASIAARALDRDTRLLPVAVDRLQVGGSLAATARLRLGLRKNGQGLVGDVELLGAAGDLLGRLEGVHTADVRVPAASSLSTGVHRVTWQPVQTGHGPVGPQGRWLILGDRGGVGAALVERFRERGDVAVLTSHGDAGPETGGDCLGTGDRQASVAFLTRTFGAEPCRGILFLWGLDAGSATATADAADLMMEQRKGVVALASLLAAIAEYGWRDLPRLWIATRGAHLMNHDAELPPEVAQAPLWGMARTAALEYPELSCVSVALEQASPDEDARRIWEEVGVEQREDHVAWHGGVRHAARIEPIAPPAPVAPMFKADRSYLVTGGLGGLGLSLARWMAGAGARDLVLLSRRPVAAGVPVADELRAAGARVEVVNADVVNLPALEAIAASARQRHAPLAGVVHAAGVLDDGMLARLTEEQIMRVLAPKVAGAWNLHRLTRQESLDFFILFSSVTSWLGSPGQANYAAANAFLDALARHRAAVGLPALSIAWGPFAEIGMAAASAARGERMATRGLRLLNPEDAWALLPRLLAQQVPDVGVFSLEHRQWSEFYPSAASSSYLAAFARAEAGPTRTPSTDHALRRRLIEVAPDQRQALVEEALADLLAEVLNADSSRIDRHRAFGDLGLDSLLSLELRNRLEAIVGEKLSATLLFTYANLSALTAFVVGKLGGGPERPQAAPRTPSVRLVAAPLVAREEIEAMSDEDAERMLVDSLKQLEI